ncbi:hypothetical protein C7405_13219 [Paraburkholderia caballeronis]|nr:hypothetical protein C7405_13219 [Paraburkholderia caballeronis]
MPEALIQQARAIGPSVVPQTLADTVMLVMPFRAYRDVAQALPDWRGKTVIDATNAHGVPMDELGELPSSAVIARAFAGARFVKGFSHLPAAVLAVDPKVDGGRRVIFLLSDDERAAAPALARGHAWMPLIFLDLVKPE